MTSRSITLHGPSRAASADWRGLARIGYIFLASVFGVTLVWAFLVRLDGGAVAQGVVSVESSRKTIQHLEGGIVREILVRDGDTVQRDSVLVRLDPTRIDSTNELYRVQLATALAQEARLIAEREMKDNVAFPAEITEIESNPTVARAISDQTRQFQVRRDNLMQTIQMAEAQIAQAVKEAQQNDIDNATSRAIQETATRELEAVQYLYDKNLVALPRLTALQREKARVEGVIASTEAGKVRLQEKIREFTGRRDKLTQDYRQDAAGRLGDLQKSISELRQQVILAGDSQRRIDVRAPITGVVQQMRIFTVGGVIRPGDPIMDLVPTSDDLVIRAKVSTLDIDRIQAGMDAEVRFPSFRTFGLPVIRGNVVAISRDRLMDEVTKEPYFDAQVNVGRNDLPESLRSKLSAGMPAEVVMTTGERNVFDYLVSPIIERFHTSMRER
jgi:HlyD family type I secretion membrane fusion protein